MSADIRKCNECGKNYEQYPEFSCLTESICDPCDQAREARTREEIRKRNALERYVKVVPLDYRNTDINHPAYVAQAKMRSLAAAWMRGNAPNEEDLKMFIGFIGESGRCKTRLAAMMAKNLIEDGYGVTWINSYEFQFAAQNQFNNEFSQEAKRIIRSAQSASWLVFDDLGNLDSTRAIAKTLYAILEHRISSRRPMIWTSNEDVDQMITSESVSKEDRERVISRIIGNSNIIKI